MDTLSAFAMGTANRGKPCRVFDWMKAVEIINRNPDHEYEAGLSGDWSYTGGNIWRDGKPNTEDYTYLASTWATPQLYDVTAGCYYDCWVWKDQTEWNQDTKWPPEVLPATGNDADAVPIVVESN